MARIISDIWPQSSGSASLGAEMENGGFTGEIRPFAHVHMNSGVFHNEHGQSGVIRFNQQVGSFETSIDGGKTYNSLLTSLSGTTVLKPRPAPSFNGDKGPNPPGLGGPNRHYAQFTWAPTTQALEIEWTAIVPPIDPQNLPSSQDAHFGDTLNEFAIFDVNDGSLDAYACSFIVGSVTVQTNEGYFIHDNLPHRYKITWDGSDSTFYRDGIFFQTITHTTTITTTPFSIGIGDRTSPTSSSQMNGIVYDVKITDPASDANTAFFALDAYQGNFKNTWLNSTVGNATRVGNLFSEIVIDKVGATPSGTMNVPFPSGTRGVNGISVRQIGGNFIVDGAPVSGLIVPSGGIGGINGQIGPHIEIQGVNGISVTVPSTNNILVNGAALSGVTSLQSAYNGGDEINLRRNNVGYKGVLLKEVNGTVRPSLYYTAMLNQAMESYGIAISGITGTPLDFNTFAFTKIDAGALIIHGSGSITNLAKSLFVGFDHNNFGDDPVINTSGNLNIRTFRLPNTPITDIKIRSASDIILTADGLANFGGGQISLRPFASSGTLEYRFGPHQAWYWQSTHAATGGPFNDGFWPIPHSGNMMYEILSRSSGVRGVNGITVFGSDNNFIVDGAALSGLITPSGGIGGINGQIGPHIEIQGINGVTVTVPSTNTILINTASLSGLIGGGTSLQSAYDSGPKIYLSRTGDDNLDIVSVDGKTRFSRPPAGGSVPAPINISGVPGIATGSLEIGDLNMYSHSMVMKHGPFTEPTTDAEATARSLGIGTLSVNTGSGVINVSVGSGIFRATNSASVSRPTGITTTQYVLITGIDKQIIFDSNFSLESTTAANASGIRIWSPGLYRASYNMRVNTTTTAGVGIKMDLNNTEIITSRTIVPINFNLFESANNSDVLFVVKPNQIGAILSILWALDSGADQTVSIPSANLLGITIEKIGPPRDWNNT